MSNSQSRPAAMRPAETIGRLWRWWVSELSQLVPSRLRRIYAAEPCRLVTVFSSDGVKIYKESQGLSRSGNPLRLMHDGDWSTALPYITRYRRRWGWVSSTGLRIPAEQCLIRTKILPVSALRQADDILLLDMERISPFSRDDVLTGWYRLDEHGGDPAMARLKQIIVKRALVDSYLADLEGHRISPATIDVIDKSGRVLPVNLLPKPTRARLISGGVLSKAIVLAAAIAVLLAAGIAFFTIHRQEAALSQLANESAVIRKKAFAIRKRLAKSDRARGEITQHRYRKIDRLPMVRIWEEVTRLLPSSVWVTSLRIDGERLYLNGFARSASELIAILEHSKYLNNVAFASPVVADARQKQERFQIKARIGQAGRSGKDRGGTIGTSNPGRRGK